MQEENVYPPPSPIQQPVHYQPMPEQSQQAAYYRSAPTCYYHPGFAPVGSCRQCGKNLCRTCFDQTQGVCHECRAANAQAHKSRRKTDALIDVIVAAVALSMIGSLVMYIVLIGGVQSEEFGQRILQAILIYLIAGTIIGWRAINRWTHRDEKIVITWSIIGVILKLFAAYFVGAFTWPFVAIGSLLRLFKK